MATSAADDLKMLYDAGTHVGYARTRRHPSSSTFLFATKDRTDIFDLEETQRRLEAASAFAASLAQAGKTLLFVGGKHEASSSVKSGAEKAGLPYVAGRWIGGTLTNFKNIHKRIERLEKLMADRESGELEKYTKKERLMIDREI
jgi:small subunit ribosomal protein S2